MKRGIVISLSIALFFCLPSTLLAKELKTIKLVYSNNAPAHAGGNVFLLSVWLPKINGELNKVGYKLDITAYHASSLYKYKGQVTACEKGLIDMTNLIVSMEEHRAPLHMVLNLPMMGFTVQSNSQIWFDLQENIPEFGDEFAKYKEIFHFSVDPYIFNANKELRVPADFKGKKVGCSGAQADLMLSIHAAPLTIDAPDRYTSIDRGLVEVLPLGLCSITMFKLHEVAKIHIFPTGNNLGMVNLSFIINRKKFDQLPNEVKQVIEAQVSWASKLSTSLEEENYRKATELVSEYGNKIVRLTKEEMALWDEAATPVQQNWVAEMEENNLPGRKVFDEAKRLISEYGL